MKSTLKIEKCTSSIVNFSMGIVNAEEFNFVIDMDEVWPGFIGLNTFQQCTLLYALKQRFSDATGKKDESGLEKKAIVDKLIKSHEEQKYNTGIRMSSKPGINIVKADVILASLNTLAMAKALTETVFEAILDGNTIVSVLGSAKESPNAGLRTYLVNSETFDWDTIQDEVDDLEQEIILHARKAKALRAENKAKRGAKK